MEDPRRGVGRTTVVGTPVQIVIPPKPSSTAQLEREADNAVAFLDRLSSSSRLDPELRLQMKDVEHVIRTLKDKVVTLTESANKEHDNLVEVVRSQRLMG